MEREDTRILRDKLPAGGLIGPPIPVERHEDDYEAEVTLSGTSQEVKLIIDGLRALMGSLAVQGAIKGQELPLTDTVKTLLDQIAEPNIVDTKDLRRTDGTGVVLRTRSQKIMDRVVEKMCSNEEGEPTEQVASVELSEMDKKGLIIGAMLDNIKPINDKMPDDVKERVDAERQWLVMQAGWGTLELAELEKIYRGGAGKPLPY